jgi:transposase
VAALTGNYRAEHLFALRQNFAAYQFLLKQIAECDNEIEAVLTTLGRLATTPVSTSSHTSQAVAKHSPSFDIRDPLHRLTGAPI